MKNKLSNYIAWLLLLVIATYVGYNRLRPKNQAAQNPFIAYQNEKQAPLPSLSDTLITIDNKSIEFNSLPRDVQFELFREEQNFREKQNVILKNFAIRFHASKEKTPDIRVQDTPTIASFINTNISEKDVDQVFEKEKDKYPPGTPLQEIRNQIKFKLISENYFKFYFSSLTDLYSRKKIKMNTTFSTIPEEWLEFNDSPKLGSSNAKNKLILIANYTCSACKKLHVDLGNLYTKLGHENLEMTFIPYDEINKPNAPLNRVAMCVFSQSQELFWKFHVNLINDSNSNNAVDPEEVSSRYLKGLSINMPAFNACVQDKTFKMRDQLMKSKNKLAFLNISELPIIILNGKKLDIEGKKILSAIEENLINE